ncbi:cell wall integrity and stress response component [Microdochium nivale]|nr:cell wall integrity and stress response component [Microdochium nivale]
MRTGAAFGLAVASLAVLALGDGFESNFLFPAGVDNSLTFHYLDTIEVSWVSNYTEPKLWLFCRRPNDSEPRSQLTKSVAEFNGTQGIKLDFQGMSGCWFNLRSKDEKLGINGINWKYDNTEGDQATLGLSASSAAPSQTASSPTSSTITRATTTATGTTTPLPSGAPPPSADSAAEGLSTGTKAGIGAGAAVAGLAIIGALAFCLTRRRRRAERGPSAPELSAAGTPATQYQSVPTGENKAAWPSQYGQHPASSPPPPPQYNSQVPQEMYSGPMPGPAHEMYVEPQSRPTELPSPDIRR